MNNKMFSNIFISAFILSLIACGSGSDPEPEPVNQAPSVSAQDQQVTEGQQVSITANGTDSDGTISSYQWSLISGEQVTLSGENSNTVNFPAPEVIQDSNIVLRVTVTDNDGSTASTEVTVEVTAVILSISLNGLVTDGPIENANVVASVGEQIFSTVADINGMYSVNISVDDSLENEVVSITATGAEAGSPVKLVSLLGSLGDLVEKAGEDAVLVKAEEFGVNVTNVSTAIWASMEEANGNQPILA